jgi:RNA polymerase sigma-70 factor, ECF subfamily
VTPGDSEGDEALVSRIRAGERSLFGDLVRRHRTDIRRLLRTYVATDEEAEDLTQQAFVSALRALDGFRGEASFRTWLHRIAVNAAKNHARDTKRRKLVPIEDVEIITNALATGRMAVREARRRLASALERLPPKQRLVVELRLVHEMSFRAIAGFADCSEDSAKSNFQHAVKQLRVWVMGEEKK